jgi:hypothetical protein
VHIVLPAPLLQLIAQLALRALRRVKHLYLLVQLVHVVHIAVAQVRLQVLLVLLIIIVPLEHHPIQIIHDPVVLTLNQPAYILHPNVRIVQLAIIVQAVLALHLAPWVGTIHTPAVNRVPVVCTVRQDMHAHPRE